MYQLGLIDTNGRREFIKYENRQIDCLKTRDYECAYDAYGKIIHTHKDSLFSNLTGYKTTMNFLQTELFHIAATFSDFIQKNETRRAIHVGKNHFTGLGDGNEVKKHLKLDLMHSVAPWVAELLSHYSFLIYNGQLDIIAAYPMTENYIKHLNFTGADQYRDAPRSIWRVDNEIAGYAKHGGKLTTVLIRNAGKFISCIDKAVLNFLNGVLNVLYS